MNQAYKEALAIIVRQVLITAGTAVGVSGYLTPYLGELTNTVVAGLLVAGTVGWSQMVQLFKRQKLVQSLQVANISENTVEVMVANKSVTTPSVLVSKHEVPQ